MPIRSYHSQKRWCSPHTDWTCSPWLCLTHSRCTFFSFFLKCVQVSLCCLMKVLFQRLTAVMEGFLPSPAGGCVTSAPRKITGCWNTADLRERMKEMQITLTHKGSAGSSEGFITMTGWERSAHRLQSSRTFLALNTLTEIRKLLQQETKYTFNQETKKTDDAKLRNLIKFSLSSPEIKKKKRKKIVQLIQSSLNKRSCKLKATI